MMIPDLTPIERYLRDTGRTPFFLFVGADGYAAARGELLSMGLSPLPLSTLCPAADRLPLADDVVAAVRARTAAGEQIVVTGLAEYLALRGVAEAERLMRRLKDLSCGLGAAVLLLRNFFAWAGVVTSDPRMVAGERRVALRRTAADDGALLPGQMMELMVVAPELPAEGALCGMQNVLHAWEEGRGGTLTVQSRQVLPEALIPVQQVRSAYDLLRLRVSTLTVPEDCGTPEEWARLLKELAGRQDMSVLLSRYDLDGDPARDFDGRTRGDVFRRWLYFLTLRMACPRLAARHPYLARVAETAGTADELRAAAVNGIASVSVQDPAFGRMAAERKALLRGFEEAELAGFVAQNRRIRAERIARLTDGTEVEREDVIAALTYDDGAGYATWRDCTVLPEVYPALASYAADYVFRGACDTELTAYFTAYKRQKVSNRVEDMFLHDVERLARSRIYNALPTRENLLAKIPVEGTYLYWLDALGAEYLALIAACARHHHLHIRVQVGRAMLPTITSVNRGFYDEWQGNKYSDKRLDELKHGEKSRYNAAQEQYPIHLAREIALIEEVMHHAACMLAEGRYRRFVLVSDHGASRLAVLGAKEEKYPTDTGGEHSGRCCRMFDGYAHDLPFATKENGYLVLADYGRFAGSRRASVEVHGGATLEEVVVPLITLERMDSRTVQVSLVDAKVTADRKTGVRLALFADAPLETLRVVWQGASYEGERQDAQHFAVEIPTLTHAGRYELAVYTGDTLLGTVTADVETRGMKMNDDDFL